MIFISSKIFSCVVAKEPQDFGLPGSIARAL